MTRFDGIRHGRLKRSNATVNFLRGLLTTFLVVFLSGVGVAAYAIWDMAGDLQTVKLGNDGDGGPDGVRFAGKEFEGEIAIALVGSDTRLGQTIQDDNEGELNDVNLLLYIDESHTNATVVSFPRDLMIPTPWCPGPNGEPDYFYPASERQFNSTLETGGLACVVRTMEEIVDFEIPYAGLVTFDGVINMSNAIGGVDVCLTEPIYDPKADLDLPAGDVTLVGYDALQFLRTRHGVGDGSDKSRISNQQIYMASMMRKLRSADTLGDPAKVFRLARATVDNVMLSESLMSIPVLQSIALAVKDLDLENINFVQFPTYQHAYDENRLSPDWVAAEELFTLMREGVSLEVGSLGEGVIEQGAETDEGVVEPIEPDTTEEPGYEDPIEAGDEPGDSTPSRVQVSENILGQSAAQVTCSQGRTQF